MPTIKLSSKQQKAFELLSDPTVVELLFGGGADGREDQPIVERIQ